MYMEWFDIDLHGQFGVIYDTNYFFEHWHNLNMLSGRGIVQRSTLFLLPICRRLLKSGESGGLAVNVGCDRGFTLKRGARLYIPRHEVRWNKFPRPQKSTPQKPQHAGPCPRYPSYFQVLSMNAKLKLNFNMTVQTNRRYICRRLLYWYSRC